MCSALNLAQKNILSVESEKHKLKYGPDEWMISCDPGAQKQS